MEKSTEENATSDSLRELHRIVTDIKKDGDGCNRYRYVKYLNKTEF